MWHHILVYCLVFPACTAILLTLDRICLPLCFRIAHMFLIVVLANENTLSLLFCRVRCHFVYATLPFSFFGVPFHPYVSLLSPVWSPWIFHYDVVMALACSIPYCCYSVIQFTPTITIKDTLQFCFIILVNLECINSSFFTQASGKSYLPLYRTESLGQKPLWQHWLAGEPVLSIDSLHCFLAHLDSH